MSFEDETGKFFEAEAERDRQRIEFELAVAEINAEILAALERNRTIHVWHPEEARREHNVEAAAATLEKNPERREQGRILARAILIQELGDINSVQFALLAKRFGLMPEVEAENKKKIQAQFKVHGYNESWLKAVDELLEGESLDISKEEDRQLYLTVLEGELLPDQSSLLQKIKGIVATAPEELFVQILTANIQLEDRPTAEAYIDEMFRECLIDEGQVAQLKALLA